MSGMIPNVLVNQSQVRLADTWYNVLTKTHVISVQMYTTGASEDATVLIQAFIVPDSAIPHDVGELRLTHEVILDTYLHYSGLLRNSIVDPVTGSVNIRLFHATAIGPTAGESHMMCLDLTLPKPVSNTDVPPISIRSQHLFESTWDLEQYTVSDDGSARKFAVDASKEECTSAVSDPGPLGLPIEEDINIVFDGTRGRVHYIWAEDGVTEVDVVTLDLA